VRLLANRAAGIGPLFLIGITAARPGETVEASAAVACGDTGGDP
jgi:hypothetical protein